jgi:hypothetical protein
MYASQNCNFKILFCITQIYIHSPVAFCVAMRSWKPNIIHEKRSRRRNRYVILYKFFGIGIITHIPHKEGLYWYFTYSTISNWHQVWPHCVSEPALATRWCPLRWIPLVKQLSPSLAAYTHLLPRLNRIQFYLQLLMPLHNITHRRKKRNLVSMYLHVYICVYVYIVTCRVVHPTKMMGYSSDDCIY